MIKITTEYWNILGKMVCCIISAIVGVQRQVVFYFQDVWTRGIYYIGIYRMYKFLVKIFWKSWRKVLTLGAYCGILNKLSARVDELKSSETSAKQQIVPCKLNNDVLKLLFDMNKVVVRTWNFESFLLLVNRWKSQLQLK